jgi:hypothetical protein
VAAARKQAEERRLERLRLEVKRRDVPVQVVDRRERQPPGPCERLRRRDADEERADEPGPARDADEVEAVERRVRLAERLPDDGQHELEMAARRDLGHDAAEARVELGLRGDDVRPDLTVVRDDRRSGLVARGLDAEDHATGCGCGSRHMISASSRLSV